ncbi:NucA/NucB deoxyribonuclease domain-containing protein [Embleya sp. NPDC008237]|uniref:NucA/NucB deoxyribonuclease domain-containing protein n=1 Tax=Embleya sp. NPDC008237 TaxID=3363978 RepID=UPI0036E14FCA
MTPPRPRPRRRALRRVLVPMVAALLTLAAAPADTTPSAGAGPAGIGPAARAALAADLRQECARHPVEAASPTGWVRSRFEVCVHRRREVVLVTKDRPPKRLGTMWFDEWQLGFAYDGDRRVDFVSSLENIQASTVPGQDARTWPIRVTYSATVSDGGGADIVRPAGQDRTDLWGAWDARPQTVLTYTSPDGAVTTPFKKLFSTMLVRFEVTGPPGADPYVDERSAVFRVRFDSAGRVAGKTRGTVFPDHKPTFAVSLGNPDEDESARHIDDALRHPVKTFPPTVGKNVPAELHRLIDPALQEQNRAAAGKVCTEVWGDWAGQRLDCDEYPFAATKEGASLSGGHFSARLIDRDDNQRVGSRLGSTFYGEHRMLDGDAFLVTVVP